MIMAILGWSLDLVNFSNVKGYLYYQLVVKTWAPGIGSPPVRMQVILQDIDLARDWDTDSESEEWWKVSEDLWGKAFYF